ncbi:PriCT-2 domain-containing protein [Bradyrhizobium barranii subsp. barranii]|uniref:PriCT-2 domain-containing protein n=2 Tax=Bradyrhizobium barranii subsp. barranii TaxID=2823807 RepID=A0A9X9Z0R1_9BRAD|nr:PriCT-2 domain-containing protein [Bradyrhizobium barranii]UGX96766.1 PriCT-2 domain-containing protein [Bradyrhizobium barranii subsp. barranii]
MKPPPMDPWAPGVRAIDVPAGCGGNESMFPDPRHAAKSKAPVSSDRPRPSDLEVLEPDREVLEQFINIVFKNANRDGVVSLRAFPEKSEGGKKEKAIFVDAIRRSDPQFIDVVFERARQAARWEQSAVFSPPVACFKNHQNAKTDNLSEGVALSVECDQAPRAARAKLEALLGMATAIVASGGEWIKRETGEVEPKLHLHWRLKKPTSIEAEHKLLREARELATRLVGGDATNISIVHPIRWPGSWHRKGDPRLASIVAFSDIEIDLAEAVKILRNAAGDDPSAGVTASFGTKTNDKLRATDDAYVASALAVIPNGDDPVVYSWEFWNGIGMKIWAATAGSEIGRKLFHKWSAKSSKYNKAETDARWDHYRTSPPTKAGFGSLVYLARQYSPGWTYGDVEDSDEPDEPAEQATAVLDNIKLDENVDWTDPEGLLATMADWIMRSSRRPNRPLAVASAVAILSAVCGRHLYGPTGCALNVYIVMLAGTAMGKDRPLSAPGAILEAADLSRLQTTAKGFSVSALEQMMIDHPCCVATADEIGASLFARISHKHASTHEQGMRSVLLELWSRDQFKGPFSTTRHAKQKDAPKVPGCVLIPRPNLTLFGASTPEAFYASVTSGSVRDGFLNRFLTCEAAARSRSQEVSEESGEVPEAIVTALKALVPDLGPFANIDGTLSVFDLAASVDVVVRRLPWDNAEVQKRAAELEEQILVAMDSDAETAPLLGRVFEYSVRLASLHAVSRDGLEAKVTMADLSWGTSWAVQSAKAMAESVAGLMASTDYEAKFNTVRNVIKNAGRIGKRELLRQVRSINARERDDIIKHLIDGGWIEGVKITTKGRMAQGWKWQ